MRNYLTLYLNKFFSYNYSISCRAEPINIVTAQVLPILEIASPIWATNIQYFTGYFTCGRAQSSMIPIAATLTASIGDILS